MDEVQRLILEVVNKDKVDQLNVRLKAEDEALKKLVVDLRDGVISIQQFEAASVKTAATMIGLNQRIKDLGQASTSLIGGRSGGLLQLGYVLDDLTNTTGGWRRKLAAISNNIPGLVMGLGGGAGIAGMVGLISTAGHRAGAARESGVGVIHRAGRIAGRESHVIDDAAERVKRLQSELDKLMKLRPMAEKQTASDVEFLIGEEGPEKVLRNLASAMGQAGEGADYTPAEKRLIAKQQEQLDFLRANGGSDKLVSAADELLRTTKTGAAAHHQGKRAPWRARCSRRLPTSAAARRRIGRLLPGTAEAPGFGKMLESVEPEFRDRADAEIQDETERYEEYKAKRARRRARTATAKSDLQNRTGQGVAQLEQDEAIQAQEARQAAQEAKEQARADQAAEKERARLRDARMKRAPHDAARDAVLEQGNRMGAPPVFTDTQIDQMADQVIRLTSQGVSTNQATLSVIAGKLQEMQRLQAQLRNQQQWAQRIGAGGNDAGRSR